MTKDEDEAWDKLMQLGLSFHQACQILEACASVGMETGNTTDELVDKYVAQKRKELGEVHKSDGGRRPKGKRTDSRP